MAMAARATAAPARSISTSTGSGAAASIAAISSGVTIGTIVKSVRGRRLAVAAYGPPEPTLAAWPSQRGHHRYGDEIAVRQRESPGGDAGRFGERQGLALDHKRRHARRGAVDPHVVEAERSETEPKRFHDGLARREPGCERRNRVDHWRHVGQFGGDEQPLAHRRGARQRRAEALDVDGVDAEPDHATLTAASGWRCR